MQVQSRSLWTNDLEIGKACGVPEDINVLYNTDEFVERFAGTY
jgi:hypothetical protein